LKKPRSPRRQADPLADARLDAVLESISDAYYAVDRNWRVVMFNGSAETFFGMTRAEMLGRNLWDIYPLGRDTEFGRLLQWVMKERQPGRLTAPSAMREGRTVEVRISPLGDGIGVSLDDISDRADAERALRRSQQRLDLAVGAHAIGIFDWHIPSGKIVWSKEEEAVFGLEPGTFQGDIDGWRKQVRPEALVRLGPT
jgi:PAS domain S-box-containing protein